MTPDDFDARGSEGSPQPDESELDGVRRLLATAHHPVPSVPGEVAQRLDDVLAGLVADRAGAPVSDLPERRAARWPKILVAAAAVSVLGLGIGNMVGVIGSGQSSDTAASRGAVPETEAEAEADAGASDAQPSPPQQKKSTSQRRAALDRDLPRLRSQSLSADAQRIADFTPAAALSDSSEKARECAVPAIEKGDDLVAVRLDGEPATLVLRAAEEGRRVAEVYACARAVTPLVSTSVTEQ